MDDSKFLEALGQRIRHIRLSKRITQHQLAKLCNFEKASMSRIESGKTNVTVLTLKKISNALETDMSEFFVPTLHIVTAETRGYNDIADSPSLASN